MRGHQVTFADEIGWNRFTNGKLLSLAEQRGFDVLVTRDQSIPYQQNFTDRKIALIVLSTNHWPTMRPAAARIATAVDFAQRAQVIRVEITAL